MTRTRLEITPKLSAVEGVRALLRAAHCSLQRAGCL